MDDQLHPAGLVEETLGDDSLLGGHRAEHPGALDHVRRGLLGGPALHAELVDEPLHCAAAVDVRVDLVPQIRHLVGQLAGASGRLTEPERDGRRRPARILDAYLAAADPADAPGVVAEEEDIAPHALDGEVLVHGADEHVVGLGYDVVVGVVRDCAAVRERDQPGPPAAAQLAVHGVPVHVGGPASLARRDAPGEHVDHLVEPLAGKLPVRVGAPDELEQLVLVLLRRA